jgi:hypothetical protein
MTQSSPFPPPPPDTQETLVPSHNGQQINPRPLHVVATKLGKYKASFHSQNIPFKMRTDLELWNRKIPEQTPQARTDNSFFFFWLAVKFQNFMLLGGLQRVMENARLTL